MGTYKIIWKRSAKKELRRLSKNTIGNILSAIEKLPDDQYLISSSKKLTGTAHTYRLRIGDYRVVYSIESNFLVIEIIRVGHRKDVYRKIT